MSPNDLALFNPNTQTCPMFRTQIDADLTHQIYQRVPVLVNELRGENAWQIAIRQGLFHLTNDVRDGVVLDGSTVNLKQQHGALRPLLEAKLIHQFDHRFASYELFQNGMTSNETDLFSLARKQLLDENLQARYHATESDLSHRIPER